MRFEPLFLRACVAFECPFGPLSCPRLCRRPRLTPKGYEWPHDALWVPGGRGWKGETNGCLGGVDPGAAQNDWRPLDWAALNWATPMHGRPRGFLRRADRQAGSDGMPQARSSDDTSRGVSVADPACRCHRYGPTRAGGLCRPLARPHLRPGSTARAPEPGASRLAAPSPVSTRAVHLVHFAQATDERHWSRWVPRAPKNPQRAAVRVADGKWPKSRTLENGCNVLARVLAARLTPFHAACSSSTHAHVHGKPGVHAAVKQSGGRGVAQIRATLG